MSLRQFLFMLVLLIASCFLSFSLFSQPTTTGMLAYFPLNGNTTNAGPASITASAVNTTYTTNNANVANKALQFGGTTSSYIDFTDNGNLDFSGTNNFTVAFSFFFNGSSTSGLVDNCLNYGGWGVWLWSTVAGTWNLQFNYRNASVGSAAATAFTIGVWHHVAAVRNNGTISLYIDGAHRLSASEGTIAPSYPINMIAGGMAYGAFSPPRYNPFGGKIDEMRIYNRALSAAEIAGLVPSALPLPVQLGNFAAVKQNAGIQLNWETLSEQNTDHFEIERSGDGVLFSSVGRVNAAGNSSDRKYYSFMDYQPLPGVNFYRLKMADIDRIYTYSRVVVVKNEDNNIDMQVFPNPASDVLQLKIKAAQQETAGISITDAAGKVVAQRNAELLQGINTISLPVLQFPADKYYITISRSSGRQTLPFIKKQ